MVKLAITPPLQGGIFGSIPNTSIHLSSGELKMLEMLGSKRLTLFCAFINGAFAFDFFINGYFGFGLICLACCSLCSYNYWSQE